jgi:HSP20 family protein
MSFLDKLKRKVDIIEEDKFSDPEKETQKKEIVTASNFAQLDVDIYESPNSFLVFAAIPGVNINNLDISVGEENDVLIIKGKKESPLELMKEKKLEHHHQECQWGDFYRQIILPQEINPELIEAYEERGVLVITLPILRLQKGKKNIQVTPASNQGEYVEKNT